MEGQDQEGDDPGVLPRVTRSLARLVVRGLGRSLGGRLPRAAHELARQTPESGPLSALDRGSCLLLVSVRRDGTPVPTPLWFARDGGRAFVRTAANSPKVARLRRTPDVAVAPCTHRGRPLGEPLHARARPLDDDNERRRADALIARRYGLRGRIWNGLVRHGRLEAAYFELATLDLS
jgi:PPOX class probable F420-dependent enzyme